MPQTITDQLVQLAESWEQERDRLAIDHDYTDAEDEIWDEMSQVYGECAAAVRKILQSAQ